MVTTANVPTRSIDDLAKLNVIPADVKILLDILFPVGKLPMGVQGEAISLNQLVRVVGVLLTAPTFNATLSPETIKSLINSEVSRAQNKENSLTMEINKLNQAVSALSTGSAKVYNTAEEANADIANIPVNVLVTVLTGEQAGNYIKNTEGATTLTKVDYDPISQTKSYVDSQVLFTRNSIAALLLGFHILAEELYSSLESDEKAQLEISALQKLITAHSNYITNIITGHNKLIATVSDLSQKQVENKVAELMFQHIVISALTDLTNWGKEKTNQLHSALILTNHLLVELEEDVKSNHEKLQTAVVMLSHVVTEAITKIQSDGFTGSGGAQARNLGSNVFEMKAPQSIIIIDVATEQNLPISKNDGLINGLIAITVDGVKFSGATQFGVQGSSSASFPKKNWSFDLFTSSDFNTKASLKIGRVMGHDTWVFKANWIDHTQVRMMSNYNLWAQIMDTRKGYPKRDIDLTYVGKIGKAAMDTGATGHPIQYPAVVYINGEFYGVGCLGIGKKRSNYNLAKNNQNQIQFDISGITSLADLAESAVEIKAPSTWGAQAQTNKTNWLTFANLPQADFNTQRDTYLNKNNIVDYYCFADFLAGADFVVKNLQFITWNGTKWFTMPYDLDMTYGLDFEGTTGRFPPTFDTFQGDRFWAKVYTSYRTDIEARYAELRRNGLFTVDHIYKNMKVLMDMYPSQLLELEYQKWPLPSLAYTSFPDIMEWVKQRIVFLDNKFNFIG